jgi:DNA-binding IscR family transcriptional regulator
MSKLTFLQEEIMRVLREREARYSNPVSSYELAQRINITPSYIRQNIIKLKKLNVVGVRRGGGGGFFLR